MLLQASPHSAAVDWQHRASANGGATHNLHRDATSLLCRTLQSTGLSSFCAEIYPFLGDNLQAVCTKLLYLVNNSCSNINWANTSILDFGGLKDANNSTKQLNLNLTYSTMLTGRENVTGVQWYTRDALAPSGTSQVALGSSVNTGNVIAAGWVNTGTRESGAVANAPASTAAGTATPRSGFQAAQNNGNRATQYYLNGVAVGGTSASGSASWSTGTVGRMFAINNGSYWKRDLLYGGITIGLPASYMPQLSQVITEFQRSLNRA